MVRCQPPGGRRTPRGGVTDEDDRRILEYAAAHAVVLVSQVQMLLGLQDREAADRLDALIAMGLLRHGSRLRHLSASYQITASGLREISSELPVPRVDLRRYWHEVSLPWLWLAAHRGRFGEVERVYSEREMRAADQSSALAVPTIDPDWSPEIRAKVADAAFGVRLEHGAVEPSGPLHYPDLVLVLPQGRVAFELRLTGHGRRPLEAVLAEYARKWSVAVVFYLVQDGAIGAAVQAAAARLTRRFRSRSTRHPLAGRTLMP